MSRQKYRVQAVRLDGDGFWYLGAVKAFSNSAWAMWADGLIRRHVLVDTGIVTTNFVEYNFNRMIADDPEGYRARLRSVRLRR